MKIIKFYSLLSDGSRNYYFLVGGLWTTKTRLVDDGTALSLIHVSPCQLHFSFPLSSYSKWLFFLPSELPANFTLAASLIGLLGQSQTYTTQILYYSSLYIRYISETPSYNLIYLSLVFYLLETSQDTHLCGLYGQNRIQTQKIVIHTT